MCVIVIQNLNCVVRKSHLKQQWLFDCLSGDKQALDSSVELIQFPVDCSTTPLYTSTVTKSESPQLVRLSRMEGHFTVYIQVLCFQIKANT